MAKKEPVFFRTPFNLGDYNDDEVNTEPSKTDPSQDEPIKRLVERMLRGELINTIPVSYDTELGTSEPAGEVFEQLPVQERDGFDISEAGPLIDSAAAALKELEPKASAAPPAPSVPPAPPAAPVPPDLKEGQPN